MTEEEYNEKLAELYREEALRSKQADKYRAQAVTIGTSGGGTTEITLRGVNGDYLWGVYHPAEVTEIIHQLAAAIGCHIALKPREDFASYREWKQLTEEDYEWLNGWAPGASTERGFSQNGRGALSADRPFRVQNEKLEARLREEIKLELLESQEKENVVATKKTVNKRSPKRSRTTSK
jgi:hypothetical protein